MYGLCLAWWVFAGESACVFGGCVFEKLLMGDLYVLADVFDRLLRR
ncbi:MAG: hypothetical protein LUD00_08275 [Prevotellaceae bacterium]|nr:hypothetical protein [Prevotellaceae bacterium]